VEVLRINDFLAMLVAQRRYYVNNKMAVASDAALQIQSVVYVGGVPQYVALPPDFTDDLAVTAACCSDGTTTIITHTHTHAHTRLTTLFPGLPG